MPQQHALRPGGVRIPRVFADHRTPEGHAYRVYVTALLRRIGPLPKDAMPTLREAGRIVVDLERLGQDRETARARNRKRDEARIGRRQFALREQLARLERRLGDLANGHTNGDPLGDVHRAVAELNR